MIKIGRISDLPKQPLNWPQCGSFDYVEENGFSVIESQKHTVLISLTIISFIFYFDVNQLVFELSCI